MKKRRKYQICALCGRNINASNRIISGIGKVGPECYSKYVGLESYLKQLQGRCFNYSTALQHVNILKCSGLRARLEPTGENAYGSLYGITIVGLLRQNVNYPKNFADYRSEFSTWLEHNQQKINIRAAA